MATVVELKFNCEHLTNKDVLSKSDPQVIVYQRIGPNWDHVGETEKIKNNLNPVFTKSIKLDYHFEVLQEIGIHVIDIDSGSSKKAYKDLNHQDSIGSVNVLLGEIISAPGRKVTKQLQNHLSRFSGNVTITAEVYTQSGQKVIFGIHGTNFDKKDTFGKSDPYYKIFTEGLSGTWSEIYKSKEIKQTLNPQFPEMKIRFEKLCVGNDPHRNVKFEFFDWDAVGDHDLIGHLIITPHEILSSPPGKPFDIINPKKFGKGSYKNSGTIVFIAPRLKQTYNFLDYIRGGCEISLMVAVDCTGSNGSVTQSSSLHYLDKSHNKLNGYEQSIHSIASVLAPYDFDGQIPIFGFGGSRHGVDNGVSHCFPLSLQNVVNGNGVADLLNIYRNSIEHINFSGPTNFSEVLDRAAQLAGSVNQLQQKYTILLILTDGEICDRNETIERIKRMASLPVSIVIVGIGHADFSTMDELDGDDHKIASRDIVQFVPLSSTLSKGPDAIAKETLKEIPKQLKSFMKASHIVPNPPRPYVPPPQFVPPVAVPPQ